MRSAAIQVNKLSPNRPKRSLSLPWRESEPVSSEATVYAGLTSREPTGVVGVRLVAECLGHESVIGSAAIPPGFDGIAIIASGVAVDAWHVEAWGGARDASLNLAIAIRQCCSGFGVCVPAELQQSLPPLEGETRGRSLPLGRADGAYRFESAQTDGSVVLDRGDRVRRVVLSARINQDASMSGADAVWVVPRRETRELLPGGNLQGPRTLGFLNVVYYSVEFVR